MYLPRCIRTEPRSSGFVAARTTGTFPLTTASSGRVQVRMSNPNIPEARRPDLRTVQVVVRCA
jgi:hypothetical protein